MMNFSHVQLLPTSSSIPRTPACSAARPKRDRGGSARYLGSLFSPNGEASPCHVPNSGDRDKDKQDDTTRVHRAIGSRKVLPLWQAHPIRDRQIEECSPIVLAHCNRPD